MAGSESKGLVARGVHLVHQLLTSHAYFGYMIALVMLGEAVLTAAIVRFVPYTEIDWKAYMQEVEGPLVQGDWDYTHLRGDTGPLVYPAGFVYLYAGFWHATEHGERIDVAQWMFVVLYLATVLVVCLIYRETRAVPPWLLLLVAASRRVHSIFVLRLFNDGICMLLAYVSVLLLTRRRWTWASLFFTLSVSVKMNALLFAPALGLVLVRSVGWLRTLPRLVLCVAVQVALAAPFLAANAPGYFHGAFEFGREFKYIWTVNFKFLSEEAFLDKRLAAGLLAGHLLVLAVFALAKWCRDEENGLWSVVARVRDAGVQLTAEHMVTVLFTCNFVGIVFARSLHFQFYSWYYHTLPYLLYLCTRRALPTVALLAIIEVCWNVFPSNAYTSAVLLAAHATLLVGLLVTRLAPAIDTGKGTEKKKKVQ